jgi:hypothetical protein
MRRSKYFLSFLPLLTLFVCKPALAYIGPGAGITLLSAIWGVIVAFFLAIGAVLLWPIRVLFRRRQNRAAKAASETANPGAPADRGN